METTTKRRSGKEVKTMSTLFLLAVLGFVYYRVAINGTTRF